MTSRPNIIRTTRGNIKTGSTIAVIKQSSSFHGTNDELMKQFA